MNKKLIISILVLAVIVLAVSFWFWAQKQKNTQKPVEEVIVNQEQKNTDIDTSDWKTYRNEELGIEFKYPDDWNIYTEGDNYANLNWSQSKERPGFQIMVRQNPGNSTVFDFYNGIKENKKIQGNEGLINWYEASYSNFKEIYIDNIKAINFISPVGIEELTAVAIPKDNLIFEIIIRGPKEIEKNGKYETILSTFKFID